MAQDIEFGVTHVGLDELIRDIMAAGDVPDEVQKNMVRAKAKIVEEAEVYTAGTMLVGPYYKGGVARSVTAKKPVMRKNGAQVDIVFKGTPREPPGRNCVCKRTRQEKPAGATVYQAGAGDQQRRGHGGGIQGNVGVAEGPQPVRREKKWQKWA